MRRFLWLCLFIAYLIWGITIQRPETPLAITLLPLILVAITCAIRTWQPIALKLRPLAQFPAIMWILWLAGFIVAFWGWIATYEASAGISAYPEEIYWGVGWVFVLIFLLPSIPSTDRPFFESLGKSAGVLITLTTLIFIISGLEWGLRYVWIMSDNFAFSKTHQNWTRLYWNPINELGYRDNPIPSADDARTHIIIAGDSLVSGYGINSIADTFPHQLEDRLGADYTVNIVAQPGWGISTAMTLLEQYPIQPDILIVSHYINDIAEGIAGQTYRQPFPTIRVEPSPELRWWVDTFYLANFLHYRLFMYTQHDSATLYNEWIRGAYQNPDVWSVYTDQELQQVIDWTQARNIQLIVVVFPNLLDIQGWRPYTDPVVAYFSERGVTTLNLADRLATIPVPQLTVNLFDAHPSMATHQIVADALSDLLK